MSEQTLPATGRAWHLEARPAGRPAPLEFALREVPIPAPGRPAAVKFGETVVDGLDGTLDAFLAMMRGENVGKTVVKL
jgi:NADPH-dependent curcumin reductase CurA